MLSLDQVRLLESRVAKALGYIDELSGENGGLRSDIASLREENSGLRARLQGYEKRIKDLEILVQDFQQDQGRIEAGILSALEKLNAFEETVEGVVVHADRAGDTLADLVIPAPVRPSAGDAGISGTVVESETELPGSVPVEAAPSAPSGKTAEEPRAEPPLFAEIPDPLLEETPPSPVADVVLETVKATAPDVDARDGEAAVAAAEADIDDGKPVNGNPVADENPVDDESRAAVEKPVTDSDAGASADEGDDDDDDAPFTLRAINFAPAKGNQSTLQSGPDAPAKATRTAHPAPIPPLPRGEGDEAPRSPRRGPDSDELDIF